MTANETTTTEELTDSVESTRELTEKTPSDSDVINDALSELCDETLTTAERLENQFALINNWSLGDGRLESRILRVTRTDPRVQNEEDQEETGTACENGDEESIYVVYWLPTENVAVEEFEKPVPWNPEEYKFARLVEGIGYGASTIDKIEGSPVVLEESEDSWRTPEADDAAFHPTEVFKTEEQGQPNDITAAIHEKIPSNNIDKQQLYRVGVLWGGGILAIYVLYTFAPMILSTIMESHAQFTEGYTELMPSGEPNSAEDTGPQPGIIADHLYTVLSVTMRLVVLVFIAHGGLFILRGMSNA